MIKLPSFKGFPQRHSVAKKTPYLCFLDDVPEYTRSAVTLPGIRDDLFKYFNNSKYDFESDRLMRLAVSITVRDFRTKPVNPRHLMDIISDKRLDIWTSSPCLPWSQYGYKTKGDVISDPDNIDSIRTFWSRVKQGNKLVPPDSMAHVRSHLIKTGEPNKLRAVWGYPLTMVLGEAMFAIPLIEGFKKANTPLAYGYETAIGGTRKIHKECKGKYFSALDFKSFDKTVHNWLISTAFKILEYNMDFTQYEGGCQASTQGLINMWDFLQNYFLNTTIRLANGERYRKTIGIPSGSYFTQIIDSIINHIIIVWCYLKLTGEPPKFIKVLGDDSLCSSDIPINLDDCQEVFSLIGMKLNVGKSVVSNSLYNMEFLGYEIRDGYPFREYQKWLSSLAYPEFPDRSVDEFMTRVLGLGYANACANDKFDVLVRFILSWRQYEITVGRHFQRWLRSQGIEYLDPKLPDHFHFRRIMGF